MDIYFAVAATILLFIIELLYFKVANRFNIIDNPNHRSSHNTITIRGGGVIFCIAILLAELVKYSYGYFFAGLVLIALISFVDDIKPLSNKLRFGAHLAAVSLLFHQVEVFKLPVLLIIVAYILVIGIINAINFMDGINGITGGYALVTLITLNYVNTSIAYVDNIYLTATICSVLVFCFFNFRNRAKCFAGDVGSIGLAFTIAFFLLLLIVKTQNVSYIFILTLYGMDSITTIIFRLWRRENIFEAHRSHFYQFLANEKQMSHPAVSILYMAIQGIMNILLLNTISRNVFDLITFLIAATFVFVFFRIILEGRDRLLNRSSDTVK